MESNLIPNNITSGEENLDAVNSNIDNLCTCGKNIGGTCECKTTEKCLQKEEDKTALKSKNRCCFVKGIHKLEVFDWLSDLPDSQNNTQMVEVQFKNTRKGYYLNSNHLDLYKGDIVAVESNPGHDIGEVTLTGKLVLLQMKKNNYRTPQGEQHRRVYRIAKPLDIEKYKEAKALEHSTMLRAREIAEELGLQMKISDVEYQGDGNKAIFYYIADERVDFRQLIKIYAEKFRVKIEMKQIGARQEAGRVGGIGPCGRELCCSNSMSSFISVSTAAARFQDISLNPQKLAGQCGKLKCCLNYEVDTYLEAQKSLPSRETILETKDGSFYHFKTDILSGMLTYSTDKNFAANLTTIPKNRVYEVIRMNKKGHKPAMLTENIEIDTKETPKDILEQDNIDRFDKKRKNKKKKITKDNTKIQQNKNSTDISDKGLDKETKNKTVKNNNSDPQKKKFRNKNHRNKDNTTSNE